jgi:lysophospholipase L1-like esterase
VSGGQIVRAAGNGFPEQFPQPFNLSVPGFTLADAFAHPFHNFSGTNPIDILSDIVFGASISPAPGCGPLSNGSTLFVSEVLCAVALQPTMIIVGIGNNDALQALTFGAPPTSKSDFAPKYHALMTVLAATRAPIVVTNIPDVTSLPFLVQAPAFRSMCGFLPAGATDGDFIVPDITNPNAINLSLCANPAVRPAALIAAAQAAVNAYNDVIKSEAKAVNAAVADFNKLFSEIAKHGYKLGNGQTLTAGFGGGLFSLDGIHPTNSGQAILANEVIKAINASFGSNIPAVSVDAIAQNDPLVPSP